MNTFNCKYCHHDLKQHDNSVETLYYADSRHLLFLCQLCDIAFLVDNVTEYLNIEQIFRGKNSFNRPELAIYVVYDQNITRVHTSTQWLEYPFIIPFHPSTINVENFEEKIRLYLTFQ